jgi:hypothetical protein
MFPSISQEYAVHDEMPLSLKQVVCVYAFIAGYIIWISGSLAFLTWIRWPSVLLLIFLAIPPLLPAYLRAKARRWRPGFK